MIIQLGCLLLQTYQSNSGFFERLSDWSGFWRSGYVNMIRNCVIIFLPGSATLVCADNNLRTETFNCYPDTGRLDLLNIATPPPFAAAPSVFAGDITVFGLNSSNFGGSYTAEYDNFQIISSRDLCGYSGMRR